MVVYINIIIVSGRPIKYLAIAMCSGRPQTSSTGVWCYRCLVLQLSGVTGVRCYRCPVLQVSGVTGVWCSQLIMAWQLQCSCM